MTSNEYRNAIEQLGLNQNTAAQWLGISRRSSQGYALGEYPIPEPTAIALRLAIELKELKRKKGKLK